MLNYNMVQLLGNVGHKKHIEVKNLSDGRKLAKFSLATHRVWHDHKSGKRHALTQWHKIVVWHPPLIELVEKYLKQGMSLFVCGELQNRVWRDQEERQHTTSEVVLYGADARIIFLDPNLSDISLPSEISAEERVMPEEGKHL